MREMNVKEALISQELFDLLNIQTKWLIFDDIWSKRATLEEKDQRYLKSIKKSQMIEWLLKQVREG